MQWRPFPLLLLVPVLALLVWLPGCQGPVPGKKRPRTEGDSEGAARKELKAASWGTFSGKVTYDGTPPPRPLIAMGANEAACHGGATQDETRDETWVVGPKGGVKNVVVYLQPPEGYYFYMPEDQLKYKDKAKGLEWAKDEVLIDQPHCAFKPHVFWLFPKYYDPKTNGYLPTEQKLVVRNSFGSQHNFNLDPRGGDTRAQNFTLQPGTHVEVTGFVPNTRPVFAKCDIHTWMKTYGFIMEHPYCAITDDEGNFTIKDAPLGVDLQVVAWHEAVLFFFPNEDGTKMKLSDNQTLQLPSIKAR